MFFVNSDSVCGQCGVDTDTSVVNLLIDLILLPEVIRYWEVGELAPNLGFYLHVAGIIGLKQPPAIRVTTGHALISVLIGDAEILDEFLAFTHLLRIEIQYRADIFQRKWQAKGCRPHHGAPPTSWIKSSSEVGAETGAFKSSVVSPLNHGRVIKCSENLCWELLSGC